MKTIGIIAEYNPFHNGHAYQIAEIKKRTGATYVIAAMSGDFVQRGAPAILDKYARAEMALSCGADLVVELPVLWSTASAESFAMAGVTLLDKMGCVDGICFGAETDNLPLLSAVADILTEEPEDYRQLLSSALKNGASFPKARAEAVCRLMDANAAVSLSGMLANPNNILALEYLKALKRRRSPITPLLLKREGSGYHDTQIDLCCGKPAASATAIRRLLLADPDISAAETDNTLQNVLPPEAYAVLQRCLTRSVPLWEDDFSAVLGYLLLRCAGEGFSDVADAGEAIAKRMAKNLPRFDSFSGFCAVNKSRDITYTRMSRILTHLLLGLTNEDYRAGRELDYIPYLRILGFRRDSSALFCRLKKHAAVPLVSRLADAKKHLSPEASALLKQDIFAADLYEQIKAQKNLSAGKETDFRRDFSRESIRI